MARANKIYAGGARHPLPQVQEANAAAVITPGMSVTYDSSGEVIPHDVAGGRGKVLIAQENYLTMKGVEDDYEVGEVVIGMEPLDEQIFRVLVATGNDVTIGAPLSSLGDGTHGVAGATSGDEVLYFAEEAYNNTSGENQLVLVRKGSGAQPTA